MNTKVMSVSIVLAVIILILTMQQVKALTEEQMNMIQQTLNETGHSQEQVNNDANAQFGSWIDKINGK